MQSSHCHTYCTLTHDHTDVHTHQHTPIYTGSHTPSHLMLGCNILEQGSSEVCPQYRKTHNRLEGQLTACARHYKDTWRRIVPFGGLTYPVCAGYKVSKAYKIITTLQYITQMNNAQLLQQKNQTKRPLNASERCRQTPCHQSVQSDSHLGLQ